VVAPPVKCHFDGGDFFPSLRKWRVEREKERKGKSGSVSQDSSIS